MLCFCRIFQLCCACFAVALLRSFFCTPPDFEEQYGCSACSGGSAYRPVGDAYVVHCQLLVRKMWVQSSSAGLALLSSHAPVARVSRLTPAMRLCAATHVALSFSFEPFARLLRLGYAAMPLFSNPRRRCTHGPDEHAPCAGTDTKVSEGYTNALATAVHLCFALRSCSACFGGSAFRPVDDTCVVDCLSLVRKMWVQSSSAGPALLSHAPVTESRGCRLRCAARRYVRYVVASG
jgi:hypothetical protein